MSLKKQTILGLFLGLGGLGWVAAGSMAVHSSKVAQDNQMLSGALTSSFIQRASLVHQLEQLTAQKSASMRVALLQDGLATGQ